MTNPVYINATLLDFHFDFSTEPASLVNVLGEPETTAVVQLGDEGDTLLTRSSELSVSVRGGEGDDFIFGGVSDDLIFYSGARGRDVVYGGGGADQFFFDTRSSGRMVIKDFDPTEDSLIFEEDFNIEKIHFGGVNNTFINDLESGEVIGVIAGINPDVLRDLYASSNLDNFNTNLL